MLGFLKSFFGRKASAKNRAVRGESSTGIAVLFDWNEIGDGFTAWRIFCESCNPSVLSENTVYMTDVDNTVCRIPNAALAERGHAFCVALPEARREQADHVRNTLSQNASKFLLPAPAFVSAPLDVLGPWGPAIGRINFEGTFTLYDGEFLWVLLRAARAKWNCVVTPREIDKFLHAVFSCYPIDKNELAIYATAIGPHLLEQALDQFRSSFARSQAQLPDDRRAARQQQCEEFMSQLQNACSKE